MTTKRTSNGYLRLMCVEDVLRLLEEHPVIDLVRYNYMPETSGYYCVFWSGEEGCGYGGIHLSKTQFHELQARTEGRLRFVLWAGRGVT